MSDQIELVQGWFRVARPEPGIFTIEEPLHEERVKSYLIEASGGRCCLTPAWGLAISARWWRS